MEQIITAILVVLPVFITITIGVILRQKNWVNEEFIHMSMKIVFNICLPSMLFLQVSKADTSILFSIDSLKFAGYSALATVIIYYISQGLSKKFIQKVDSRGTFIQGSFRSNYMIMGYAILYNLFGDQIIERMALLFIVIIPLYNILAISALTKRQSNSMVKHIFNMLCKFAKNPLIIGIFFGFVAAYFRLSIPGVVEQTLSSLATVSTPLGLIGIGAYMNFSEMSTVIDSTKAAFLKLIVYPFLVVSIGIVLGFDYIDRIILFVLFGSPTAISSFIMATALGGDPKLAANIVIISTALSLITFVVGLSVLGMI